jgi:hypothetical protein
VSHACYPSYSGGRDQEILVQSQPRPGSEGVVGEREGVGWLREGVGGRGEK